MSPAPQTLTILFADIGESTALYEEFGDLEAHRQVAQSLAFMKSAVKDHGGTLLRTVGDSSLASFHSCDDAYLAAREIQHSHVSLPLSVRVGFHRGPVIPDGGDVYGNAVNLAARVASFARPEEITATSDCVELLSLANRSLATWIDDVTMKGVSEPVGVYRMQWHERDTALTVVASKTERDLMAQKQCAMTVVSGALSMVLNAAKPVLTLGRAENSDVTLHHDEASRLHARIEFANGQFLLTDSSTNGTYVTRNLDAPLFVRRETVVLEGEGVLGFGALVNRDTSHGVQYEIHYS